jgi:hypothetical protein
MAPGPELAVVLATLDPARLTAHQLVVVIAAHNRLIAFHQARLLRAVRELGYAPPQERERVVRDPDRNGYATVDAALATTWTAYRCDQMVALARLAFDEAPALGEALSAGHLDLDKLKIFDQVLAKVAEPDVTRDIVRRALAKARDETTATLRARLQRLLAKSDPDSLRKRRERDHKDRFVFRFPESSGLVTLQARFCDPAAAAAAVDHLDAVARATKAAGEARGRTMDQLRHDIALNLLAGVDPHAAGTAGPADRKGAVILHIDLATLVGIRGLLSAAARTTAPNHECLGLCGTGPAHDHATGTASSVGPGCGLCRRALAEMVDEAGEIAGYGPVTAHIARQTAAELAQVSTWRYAVTEDGQVIAEGALPRRLLPGLFDQMRRWAVDITAGPGGRAHRMPTASQVAVVRARDRRCQAPGCRVPAHQCQVDHRIPWHRGGPTFVDNLHCLCLRHHRAKDDGGHSYRPVPWGIAWTTAIGHRYVRASEGSRRRRHRHHRVCGQEPAWLGCAPRDTGAIVLVAMTGHR